MPYTDDFTTDHWAAGDYLTLTGPPPTSVAPHAMTETGGALLWLDTRTPLAVPFHVELDIAAGPEAYLIAVGVLTLDSANGFLGGWESVVGGAVMVGSDSVDIPDNVNVTGPFVWPAGDFTIKMDVAADGTMTTTIAGVTALTATANAGLLAALAARTMYPCGYLYGAAPDLSSISVVSKEWRYDGSSSGGGGGSPPLHTGPIRADDHMSGLVPRPRRVI